jgi:hypothetical protein
MGMDIQADKFLALTAMLAGFMPVTTPTIRPGDRAEATVDSDEAGVAAAGAIASAVAPGPDRATEI